MRIIRAADCRRMPWKNGGGETTEIAVFPEAAGLDDFDWRVSMARVAADGPFSTFAGIDRTLSVLDGPGLALVFDGRGTVRLDAASLPYAFPADVAVTGRIMDGPITDLNVMTRRARWRHHVQRLAVDGACTLPRLGDLLLLLVVGNEAVSIGTKGGAAELAPGDAAVIEVASIDLAAGGATIVYAVDLWRL